MNNLEQHRRMETRMLECLLFAPERYDEVAGIVRGEHFCGDRDRAVFEAVGQLCDLGEAVDVLALAGRLQAHRPVEGDGHRYWLGVATTLAEGAISSHGLVTLAHHVANNWRLRRMVEIGQAMADAARIEGGEEAPRLLDDVMDQLSLLEPGSAGRIQVQSIGEAAETVRADVAHRTTLAEEHRLPGIRTGYGRLDYLLGGWVPRTTCVLKGDTGGGKSALALSMAWAAAKRREAKIAYVSLEMDGFTCASRIIANSGSVDAQRMRLARMDDDQIRAMIHGVDQCKSVTDWLTLVYAPALNAPGLRRLIRRLARRPGAGLGLVVVDYAQLISGGPDVRPGNREQEVAAVSAAITECAALYDLAVLALSQVNDAGQARESRRIEHDAHVVVRMALAEGEDPHDERPIYDMLIQKNRHGPLTRAGDFQWTFLKSHQRFAVVDDRGDEPPEERPRDGVRW